MELPVLAWSLTVELERLGHELRALKIGGGRFCLMMAGHGHEERVTALPALRAVSPRSFPNVRLVPGNCTRFSAGFAIG